MDKTLPSEDYTTEASSDGQFLQVEVFREMELVFSLTLIQKCIHIAEKLSCKHLLVDISQVGTKDDTFE